MLSGDQELGRLRWRCRRGMRELDAVLMRFLDAHYAGAGAAEQSAFRALLALPDPEILGLLTVREMSDDPAVASLVRRLREQPVSPDHRHTA